MSRALTPAVARQSRQEILQKRGLLAPTQPEEVFYQEGDPELLDKLYVLEARRESSREP